MKKDLTIKRTVAMLLAVIMLVIIPCQSVQAADKYVSDVYTAYGENEGSARDALKKAGYTPVDGNLNDGASTYVMLGYKTTDDPKLALRDIALMNANGGYSTGEYENLIKKKKLDIAEFLKEFMDVVKEYRANYRDGSGKAVIAHDLLNNYVEDDSKKKMGDLLLEDTLQDKVGVDAAVTADPQEGVPDLTTIIMQGNAVNIRTIYCVLAMAADNKDTSLLDRFAQKTVDDLLKESRKDGESATKAANRLSGQYGKLAETLKLFAADLGKDLKDYEKKGLELEEATPEDLDKEFGETDKIDDLDQAAAANDKAEWASTALLYENLKNYEGGNFKKGELLKFFMTDEHDAEDFYPLAAALTKGQKAALSMIPFSTLLRYSLPDESAWDEEVKNMKNANKSIDDISVYEGVDRDVYLTDGSVALTDEAMRKNAAAVASDADSSAFAKVFNTSSIIIYGVTAASITGTIVASKFMPAVENNFRTTFTNFFNEINDNFWLPLEQETDINVFMEFHGNNLQSAYNKLTKTAINGKVENTATYISEGKAYSIKKGLYSGLKYLTVALALISAGITIYNLARTDEIALPPVPKYMVNSVGDGKTVNYKAAESNGENFVKKNVGTATTFADTKAYEGKEWLMIYATRNEEAGGPITTDFVVQKESKAPKGFGGALHIIGEKGAANLVNIKYMNFSAAESIKGKKNVQYLFYKHGEAPDTASVFSGGTIAMIAAAVAVIMAMIAVLMARKKQEA